MKEYELYHASTRKHKYIKKIGNRYFYTQQEIAAYLKGKRNDVTFEKGTYDTVDGQMKDYRIDFHKDRKNGWSDGIGVRVGNKKIEVYNTTNKKYEKNPDVKGDNKGRFTREYAEDGSRYSLDYSDKKTFRKRQKEKLTRDKNYIEWLKSTGTDTSKYEAELKRDEADLKRREKKDAVRAKTLKKLRKQIAKGKKKFESIYKPKSTVEVIDRIDNRTGKHF